MRSIIQQSIILPASAEALFGMYMDPVIHTAITGAPVTIGATSGSPFHGFEGALSGYVLTVVPSSLIVQSWRSMNFAADDPDSTLILNFVPHGESGRIELVQVDVPERDFQGVTEGWEKFYWTPWRRYLAER